MDTGFREAVTSATPSGDDRLAELVNRMALGAALLVVLVLPFGYAGLAYHNHEQLLETEAHVKASAITALASGNPELWMYQVPRLEDTLAFSPVGLNNVMTTLRNESGQSIVSIGKSPRPPIMSRSRPVYESGRIVARVEIAHSYREDAYGTLFVGLLGMLIGGATYFTLRILPLRALRRVTAKLAGQRERYAMAVESAMEGYMQLESGGQLREVNAALCALTGYSRDELLALAITDLEAAESGSHILIHCTPGCHERFESRWKRRDGIVIDVEVSAANLLQDSGKLFCFVRDITDRKRSEEQIWIQANFDSLTGLPNRRMFHDRLEQELKKAHRAAYQVALLFIDLDRFKQINDTLGHDKGDLLLVEVARRIGECVRETDTVARLGGDEFTVLLSEPEVSGGIDRVVQNILRKLAAPFRLGDQVGMVSASIGIAIYPDHSGEAGELLRNADRAMYVAKKQGGNRCGYFSPGVIPPQGTLA